MIHDPALIVVDVAEHLADSAVFAQSSSVGFADDRVTRDRGFRPKRTDADHDRIERLREIIDGLEPATLDQGRLGGWAIDEARRRNEVTIRVERPREAGGKFGRIVGYEMRHADDQRNDVQTFERALT